MAKGKADKMKAKSVKKQTAPKKGEPVRNSGNQHSLTTEKQRNVSTPKRRKITNDDDKLVKKPIDKCFRRVLMHDDLQAAHECRERTSEDQNNNVTVSAGAVFQQNPNTEADPTILGSAKSLIKAIKTRKARKVMSGPESTSESADPFYEKTPVAQTSSGVQHEVDDGVAVNVDPMDDDYLENELSAPSQGDSTSTGESSEMGQTSLGSSQEDSSESESDHGHNR